LLRVVRRIHARLTRAGHGGPGSLPASLCSGRTDGVRKRLSSHAAGPCLVLDSISVRAGLPCLRVYSWRVRELHGLRGLTMPATAESPAWDRLTILLALASGIVLVSCTSLSITPNGGKYPTPVAVSVSASDRIESASLRVTVDGTDRTAEFGSLSASLTLS